MRPVETLLVVANLLTVVVVAVPPLRALHWSGSVVPLAFLLASIQVAVEGPRWQMIPAYALTVLLFLIWLLGIVVPGCMHVNRVVSILGIVVGVLILLISIALPLVIPVFHFPKPTGPYQIGTLTYHWVERSRRELFSPDPHAQRELMAQVWYPVKGDSSSARASYVPDASALSSAAAGAFSSAGVIHVPGFFFDHFQYVTTNAIPSAPLAKSQSRYPVLLYLTGIDGFRSINTFQVEELVSHGYIVVGLDQPYVSVSVVFPDGHAITGWTKPQIQPLIDQSIRPAEKAPRVNGHPLQEGIVPYLAQDVSFALDQLTALDTADPNGILTGRLDLHHVGAFGISLGAMVVGESCYRDPRLKACLMMDAAMPADVVHAGLQQASMWITRDAHTMRLERQRSGGWSEADIQQTLTTMRAVYRSLPGDGYYVQIPGMFHDNFTDLPYWSPIASQLGLTGPIDGQRGFDIVNAYSVAFFEKELKGQQTSLLQGPSKQFPDVQFETRGP